MDQKLLVSKAQIRFHPLFLVPPESGLLFGLKFEILIDWLIDLITDLFIKGPKCGSVHLNSDHYYESKCKY